MLLEEQRCFGKDASMCIQRLIVGNESHVVERFHFGENNYWQTEESVFQRLLHIVFDEKVTAVYISLSPLTGKLIFDFDEFRFLNSTKPP